MSPSFSGPRRFWELGFRVLLLLEATALGLYKLSPVAVRGGLTLLIKIASK